MNGNNLDNFRTMLIFSVYLSVCLMSQPEGWTQKEAKFKYIKLLLRTAE